MSEFAYWDSIVADRSTEGDEEDWIAGSTLISAETCEELIEDTLGTYVEDNVSGFLSCLRKLPPEDQDILLNTYVLKKSQAVQARILDRTQTVISQLCILAKQKIGCYTLYSGEPPLDAIAYFAGTMTADIVAAYLETGSFAGAGAKVGIRRVDVRRQISKTAQLLLSFDAGRRQISKTAQLLLGKNLQEEKAIGAYLHNLVQRCNPNGTGMSKALARRAYNKVLRDPVYLGEHRVRIEDVDFDVLWSPLSNID